MNIGIRKAKSDGHLRAFQFSVDDDSLKNPVSQLNRHPQGNELCRMEVVMRCPCRVG